MVWKIWWKKWFIFVPQPSEIFVVDLFLLIIVMVVIKGIFDFNFQKKNFFLVRCLYSVWNLKHVIRRLSVPVSNYKWFNDIQSPIGKSGREGAREGKGIKSPEWKVATWGDRGGGGGVGKGRVSWKKVANWGKEGSNHLNGGVEGQTIRLKNHHAWCHGISKKRNTRTKIGSNTDTVANKASCPLEQKTFSTLCLLRDHAFGINFWGFRFHLELAMEKKLADPPPSFSIIGTLILAPEVPAGCFIFLVMQVSQKRYSKKRVNDTAKKE